MSSNRKLKADIDRCFKKIQEGLNIFDMIWDKVYAASDHSQREKLSLDLKKELKKLQRCRDQIKSWIANNVVKDKVDLIAQRKRIEKRMERFKECEKEVKTKAYSKEGLAKAKEVDSEDEEIREVLSWVQDCIDKLRNQADELEADLESEEAENGEEKVINDIQMNIHEHKWHVTQLETVMRLVHNDGVDIEELNHLREEIEDYVENAVENHEEYFDDSIYDELELPAVVISSSRETLHQQQIEQEKEQERLRRIEKKRAEAQKAKKQVQIQKENAAKSIAANEKERPANLNQQKQEQKQELEKERQAAKLHKREIKIKEGPALAANKNSLPQKHQQQFHSTVPPNTDVVRNVLKDATGVASSQHQQIRDLTSTQSEQQIGGVIRSFLGRGDHPPPFNPESRVAADLKAANASLTSSLNCLPDNRDSTLVEKYKPQNPAPHLASCFPTTPLNIFDNAAIFEKLETDTLFFIFYHQQGTYQQYLAARELKRHSWRFHKKYSTWFQRHEEPTVTTDDFERGTYVYFDQEGRWGKLLKEKFTFEYRFLEDELSCA